MKRLLFFSLPVFLFAASASAQKPPIKFGDVPIEQLKMTRYDKDSSAAAVVLADYGESTIDYGSETGFRIEFERIRRVKIFTKDGYEWGNFSIPLYRDGSTEENLGSLKAVTYNLENNKVVETKMKNDAVFKEEADQNLRYVKVALPNVKEGSVIEITYRVNSPFLFNFQDWDFQSTIPTLWSEYRTRIPEYFGYKKFMQGYLAVTVNETKSEFKSFNFISREKTGIVKTSAVNEKVDYSENYTRLALKDAPAFKTEPYMTTYRDYVARINFELNSIQLPDQGLKTYNDSWADLNNDFLENESFGGVIKGSNFLKEHVEAAVAGKTDAKEKIAAIYYYVRELIDWDGQYRKYSDENLKRVIDNKKGSSAEINLTLVSMLQKAGINANPVLLSTRDHGFIRKESSVSSQFNYVIAAAEVNGKYILLDATDKSLPITLLPERCLNGEGFLVASEKSGWINITPIKSKTAVSSELVLSGDGKLKGKMQFTHDGYFAQNIRKTYNKKGKEEYVKDVGSAYGWEIESSSFENLDKLQEPVKEIHEVNLNEHIQMTGDNMYINPLLVNRLDKNPFQAENREYPVDFGSPEERLYITRITLPEGWNVEELPAPKVLVLPANSAKYVYNMSQNGNIVSFTSQLVINKALFSYDEYPNLRDFYAQVVAKQAEQIVLKKK